MNSTVFIHFFNKCVCYLKALGKGGHFVIENNRLL